MKVGMASILQRWVVLLLPAVLSLAAAAVFDENFSPVPGTDSHHLVDQGTEVRLVMDKSAGAGLMSKVTYGSGMFHLRIKIPSGYTAGVVTAFYLTSEPESGDHDEVDFEFLGNVGGKHVILQTNVFLNGVGLREQQLDLWFDPAADFHDYKILWNQHQLVMFVDETPVRVLKNLVGHVPGYQFLSRPMKIRASLWDGSAWATAGGSIKVDWNRAPFTAVLEGFNVDACPSAGDPQCSSPGLPWNALKSLMPAQQAAYNNVRGKYMTYNYCADKAKFQGRLPVECGYN